MERRVTNRHFLSFFTTNPGLHCWVLPFPEMTQQGCSFSHISLLLSVVLPLFVSSSRGGPALYPKTWLNSPWKDGCPHSVPSSRPGPTPDPLQVCVPALTLVIVACKLLVTFLWVCLSPAWCPVARFPCPQGSGCGGSCLGGEGKVTCLSSWWGAGRGHKQGCHFLSCLVFAKTA